MKQTKTLKTIQTLAKIGKIISKVLFILCIVGAAGCIAGIIGLALIPEGYKIGDVTIHGLIEKHAECSVNSIFGAVAGAAILCVGEAVLCKIAEKYFIKELADGTPFTFDGAKAMLKLGICTIAIPLATTVTAQLADLIVTKALGADSILSHSSSVSVGLGIMFIVTSLICRYGAECTQPDQEIRL